MVASADPVGAPVPLSQINQRLLTYLLKQKTNTVIPSSFRRRLGRHFVRWPTVRRAATRAADTRVCPSPACSCRSRTAASRGRSYAAGPVTARRADSVLVPLLQSSLTQTISLTYSAIQTAACCIICVMYFLLIISKKEYCLRTALSSKYDTFRDGRPSPFLDCKTTRDDRH